MDTNLHFSALVVAEDQNGQFQRAVVERRLSDLPANEVLVRVRYSSLNYKDALSATGNRGVTRNYPHTPGIDAAGVVVESNNPTFKPGDEVIVTGRELDACASREDSRVGEPPFVPLTTELPLPATDSARLTVHTTVANDTDAPVRGTLRAVISQALLKKVGGGRTAAWEIMVGTPAIRNLIREDKVAQMYSAIQTGQQYGMMTLDQHLQDLVKRGLVTRNQARDYAKDKRLFE